MGKRKQKNTEPDPPSPFGAIQHAKKRAFLAAYAETASQVRAAEAAGCSREIHWHWVRKDPLYRDLYENVAKKMAAESLEAEAVRRAREGVRRLKFHEGQPIMVEGPDGKPVPYVEHDYSDTLLIFLMKGVMPEKYRERYEHQHSGELTGKVVLVRPDNGRGPKQDADEEPNGGDDATADD